MFPSIVTWGISRPQSDAISHGSFVPTVGLAGDHLTQPSCIPKIADYPDFLPYHLWCGLRRSRDPQGKPEGSLGMGIIETSVSVALKASLTTLSFGGIGYTGYHQASNPSSFIPSFLFL